MTWSAWSTELSQPVLHIPEGAVGQGSPGWLLPRQPWLLATPVQPPLPPERWTPKALVWPWPSPQRCTECPIFPRCPGQRTDGPAPAASAPSPAATAGGVQPTAAAGAPPESPRNEPNLPGPSCVCRPGAPRPPSSPPLPAPAPGPLLVEGMVCARPSLPVTGVSRHTGPAPARKPTRRQLCAPQKPEPSHLPVAEASPNWTATCCDRSRDLSPPRTGRMGCTERTGWALLQAVPQPPQLSGLSLWPLAPPGPASHPQLDPCDPANSPSC